MSDAVQERISEHAGSVGCLIDRCLKREERLGTVWLVDGNKAATCAHLLVPYSQWLPALKVRLPGTGQDWGIAEAVYHPKFNLKTAAQLAKKSLASPVAALALQEQNLVLLSLKSKPEVLMPDFVTTVNEQLASPPPPRDKGLGGSLAELDLPLVIQTITNARKEGTLIISDERNRPVATLFCRDGRVLHARFQNLLNETAIYQVVSQRLSGNFYFHSQKEPAWPVSTPIARPTDMLLIESHRRLDEIPKLLLDLGGEDTVFRGGPEKPDLDSLPPEVRKEVELLWPLLERPIPIGQLWKLSNLDDYAIFQALLALQQAKQIEALEALDLHRRETGRPIVMAPQVPLSPFDEIQSLSVGQVLGEPLITGGHLLGTLRPGDPWHLLHNLDVPADAAGSPIFKDGQVIGMHCGKLPADPKLPPAVGNIQQLLWVESIYECLQRPAIGSSGEAPESAESKGRLAPAGCTEVARIDCPRCGSSSLDSAKFCKSCGQRLIQDLDFKRETGRRSRALAAALVTVLLLLAGVLLFMQLQPAVEPLPPGKPAVTPRLRVTISKADTEKAEWVAMPADHVFHNGDLVRLEVRPLEDSFVYVLHEGTTSPAATLIFPDSSAYDVRYLAGNLITIPRSSDTNSDRLRVALQGLSVYGPAGTDTLVFLASSAPSSLRTSPKELTAAFEKASTALNQAFSPNGVDLPARAFGPGIFPASVKSAETQTVYLTKLEIKHED